MTMSEFETLYNKKAKNKEPFELMVKNKMGFWSKNIVVGITMCGTPVFSGWFVSGSFEIEEIMTVGAYNAIQPSDHPLNNKDKTEPINEVTNFKFDCDGGSLSWQNT